MPARDAAANALADADAIHRKLKLLWIACSKNDSLLQRSQTSIARLKEGNLHHEWQLTDGDHSWPVWRKYLAEFARKLFQ